MNIGWVGLGRLGLPCALVLADCGHEVTGYDISDRAAKVLAGVEPAPQERGLQALLRRTTMELAATVPALVQQSDVVFVAVQTPHAPEFGGEQPMPALPQDFDYRALMVAIRQVAASARQQRKHVTVVVVSTALPGTFARLLRPLGNSYATLVYSPAFIAMGTTIADFRSPEFVLVGADADEHAEPLRKVFAAVHDVPLRIMSPDSAELTKVAYNTFISLKIVFANTVMEICDKTGADCDAVSDALALATDRVVSTAYLRGGMGDGGACHPRDLIAMSWLAHKLDLSTDLMGYLARAREAQTVALADKIQTWQRCTRLPLVLLGKAYKPESNLIDGSPALLLASMLRDRGLDVAHYDPYVTDWPGVFRAGVYTVTTRHECWLTFDFPAGSVVLDPFGYIPDRPGVTVVRIGRKS